MYRTRDEYRAAWERSKTEDAPIPLNVDIELASVCNLTCDFCFISDKAFDNFIKTKSGDGKSRRRLMETKLALKIVYEAAEIGVPALKFNWRGESTLHPEYSDIIQAARSCSYDADPCRPNESGRGRDRRPSFHDLLVNTNANCPDSAIPGLMAATKVMVSLDSCRPETYAIMRRGGNLQRAIEVVRELVHRGHPNIWVRRVLTKDNRHEPFLEEVRGLFGDFVKVSEHHCFDRNADSSHEVGCDHDGEPDLKRTYCQYPSQRLVIASSGLVYPCCIDLHETMPVGDITKQSLLQIWNGGPMQILRGELRQGRYISKACAGCQSWMSYDAPERAKVQDVEVKA